MSNAAAESGVDADRRTSVSSPVQVEGRHQFLPLLGPEPEVRRAYQYWCETCDDLNADDVLAMRRTIAAMPDPPALHVLLFAEDIRSPLAERSIAALADQVYRNFSFQVLAPVEPAVGVDDADAPPGRALAELNAALGGRLADSWLLFLFAGDVLAPHALYWFAREISRFPGSAAIYSDDDVLDGMGQRVQPRFKPDWSLTHFHSTDFIGNAAVFPAALVAQAGGVDGALSRYGPYGLLLRMLDMRTGGCDAVRHVPGVLLHRRPAPSISAAQTAWQRRVLERHFLRRGGGVDICATRVGVFRVRHGLPSPPPKVSIIIPTRDAPALLRRCIESLLAGTRYPDVEILVVDNQSRDPAALSYLASLPQRRDHGWHIRVLRYDRAFNFADMNNRAAREAQGELLCLLNNDTEVIAADWLAEMVGRLLQPGVGAVGAKLFYPDGRVQHAGDVVGRGGCANHLHSRIPRDDPGYCNRAAVAQELSAVTAACLLTPKSVYLQLGGLDARFLRVTFNDVDYCLRLRQAGLKVVWTPYASLYHHESVSRGKARGWRKRLRAKYEAAVMRRRWKEAMQNDPFYNPNFSHRRADFALAPFPLVQRPWRQA